MTRFPMFAALFRIALLVIALGVSSCASRSEPAALEPTVSGKAVVIDRLEDLPQLPMTPGTKVFRGVLRTVPGAEKLVFWGNYGGPGNNGGAPMDAMDVLFLEHDLVYVRKESFQSLRESDRVLADSLELLDPVSLTEESQEFRKRAIFYMRSPLGTFGKLIGTINNPPPPPGIPQFEELGPFPFPELRNIFRFQRLRDFVNPLE